MRHPHTFICYEIIRCRGRGGGSIKYYVHYKKNGAYQGADKSLARPGRKQSTATKLLQATQKNSGCPSNQVSAAAMTSASDEKWRPFNCFCSRVGLRTYQYPCKFTPLTSIFYQFSYSCQLCIVKKSLPQRKQTESPLPRPTGSCPLEKSN